MKISAEVSHGIIREVRGKFRLVSPILKQYHKYVSNLLEMGGAVAEV